MRLVVGVAVGKEQDRLPQLVQNEDIRHLRCQSDVFRSHSQPAKPRVRNVPVSSV